MMFKNVAVKKYELKPLLPVTITIAAWLVVILGALTATAWISSSFGLAALFPYWLYSMKYHTSLLFMSSGIGLIAAVRVSKVGVIVAGTFTVLLSGLTLLEYLMGARLGIDEWLIKDFTSVGQNYPGRMAPGSALAFFCAGAQLLLTLKSKWRLVSAIAMMELLGFLVFALGAEELLAYIQGVAETYSWNGYTHMAPQTTMGLVVLGTSLLAFAWYLQDIKVLRMPLWAPGTLCFLILLFDLGTPRGVDAGIAYIPLVFCSLWFKRPHTAFVLAATATLLTLVAFFVKASSGSNTRLWIIILDRFMIVSAVWSVAVLVYLRRTSELALQKSNARLSAVVDYAVDGLDPPPINESKSGVNPDRFWTQFMEQRNGKKAVYGRADHRASAAG